MTEVREELRKALDAAWTKAEKERDTWACPECGDTVELSGAVHIEWGTPECGVCLGKTGRAVKRRLVAINPVN